LLVAQALKETPAMDKNHDGTIQYRHAGALTPQVWQEQFQPLLKHP